MARLRARRQRPPLPGGDVLRPAVRLTEGSGAIRSVLRAGLAFLERSQTPSGRFPVAAGGDRSLSGSRYDDDTPFVTAFLAPALEVVGGPVATRMRDRAVTYLVATSEPPGVWRYWRNADHVLDPDLDDTACASLAVGPRHLSVLSGANRPLFLRNRDAEGRFKTWLRPERRRNDVDSVVNANVVNYLGEGPETKAAIAWLLALVRDGAVEGTSRYYLDDLVSLAYCMARGAGRGVASFATAGPALTRQLLARRRADGGFGSSLATAMTLSALATFGPHEREVLDTAAERLAEAQRDDGSWVEDAFYCGPEPPGPPTVFFASRALTTGLCLEALVRVASASPPAAAS